MLPFQPRDMWSDGDAFQDHLGVEGAPRIARQHLCYFGKGGGGTQTSTSKTTTELPGWIDDQAKSNLWEANSVAAGLDTYKGQRVADMTPGMQSLINMSLGNVGSANPWFNTAAGTASSLTGYGAPTVTADMLKNTDLSGYMSPYADAVKKSGLDTLERGRLQGQNQIDAGASMSKAFGGSRGEIQKAVLDSENARQKADFTAGIDDANFKQAQQAAIGDITRKIGVDQGNQAADLSSAGMRLNAANGLAGIGAQQQNTFLTGLSSALAGQGLSQTQSQAILDAAKAQWDEENLLPLQRLQVKQGALAGTPYGSTTTGTQTQPAPQSNGFMQGLGAVASTIGTVGSLGGLFAAPGASAASGLGTMMSSLPFLSDETTKTDVQKLGRDPKTGLDMYAYRYKGDPKHYPKIVGPMAQDVAEEFPDMVRDVGGRLAVAPALFNFLGGPTAALHRDI